MECPDRQEDSSVTWELRSMVLSVSFLLTRTIPMSRVNPQCESQMKEWGDNGRTLTIITTDGALTKCVCHLHQEEEEAPGKKSGWRTSKQILNLKQQG